MTFLDEERVFLVRQGNTFRCLRPICTHLGCTVNRTGKGTIARATAACLTTRAASKAARRLAPLAWFSVTLSKDNRLLVNKSQRVNADKYLVL